MGFPSTVRLPLVACKSRVKIWSVVDFPAPLIPASTVRRQDYGKSGRLTSFRNTLRYGQGGWCQLLQYRSSTATTTTRLDWLVSLDTSNGHDKHNADVELMAMAVVIMTVLMAMMMAMLMECLSRWSSPSSPKHPPFFTPRLKPLTAHLGRWWAEDMGPGTPTRIERETG